MKLTIYSAWSMQMISTATNNDPVPSINRAKELFDQWVSDHTTRIDNAWFCEIDSLARIHATRRVRVNVFHVLRSGGILIHAIIDVDEVPVSGIYINVVDKFPDGGVRCKAR